MPNRIHEINPDEANRIAQAAIDYAMNHHLDITVAVVDLRGDLVAFRRTAGVIRPAVKFAIDKARTAATLRRSTYSFGQRMGSDPSLSSGLTAQPHLSTWQGGLPVIWHGEVIGAIGVSGAAAEEDEACARAAVSIESDFQTVDEF